MNKATLEAQANAIDAALAAYNIAGRVTGGTMLPGLVRYTVEVTMDETWTVDDLLDGLAHYRRPYTAALGIAEDGAPLLVNLDSAEGAHILITGKERAELLNIVIRSLQQWNSRDDLRIGLMGSYVEHLARAVTTGRPRRRPMLVALADRTCLSPALRAVLSYGPPQGVHVVMEMACTKPDWAVLFPTHIHGLGGGYFRCVAPDFRGVFQAPTDGRGKEVMPSRLARHRTRRPDLCQTAPRW